MQSICQSFHFSLMLFIVLMKIVKVMQIFNWKKKYSLKNMLHFTDNWPFRGTSNLKSHIIPGFTCSLYTAYLLLVLIEMFLNFGPLFHLDSNFFFSHQRSKVTGNLNWTVPEIHIWVKKKKKNCIMRTKKSCSHQEDRWSKDDLKGTVVSLPSKKTNKKKKTAKNILTAHSSVT